MRRFTEKDFQTRERAEKVLLDVLNPLKPYYSESYARLYVGNTSTHYENDTIPMESFGPPPVGAGSFLGRRGK